LVSGLRPGAPPRRIPRPPSIRCGYARRGARHPPDGEADIIVARAFADLAALRILQHRASAEAMRLNEQLSAALSSRIVIEEAKGVISERAGIDLAEAFARLRGYARNANLPLTDVARAAVDGTLDSRAWTSARG